jgi:4-hydroxy-2-oxoheptanedioate aldolase
MISANSVLRKLRNNEPVFGPLINFSSPWFVDVVGATGFDFVLLDAEHGPLSLESTEQMIRAAESAGITPLVRVPANVPHEILRFLDIGAMGVQVPQLNSAADARAAANAVRFPPHGTRGLATLPRAAGYGIGPSAPDYIEIANREIVLMAMVETREGVENIDAIAAMEGVDIIAIGPGDLSASLGFQGDRSAPAVRDALEHVIERSHANGRWVSLPATDIDSARALVKRGVEMVQLMPAAWMNGLGKHFLSEVRA